MGSLVHRSKYLPILLMTIGTLSAERPRIPMEKKIMLRLGDNWLILRLITVSNSVRNALFSVAGNEAIRAASARSVA